MLFIAHRLILRSNDGRSANFEYQDLLVAHSIFNDLDEPFLDDNDLLGFLGRISNEQFWCQDSHLNMYDFSRNYIIFVELHDKFKSQIKVDLDTVFYESFNLTIKEFLIIGFVVFAQSQNNPCFTLEDLCDIHFPELPELDKVLKTEKINSFISLVSASYSQVRSLSYASNQKILPVMGTSKNRFVDG